MFAQQTIMDQVLERLLDRGVTWFCRQLREPPVQDSGLCVLCIWILAQVFPDRLHCFSYARFMHHTSMCRLDPRKSNSWTTRNNQEFIERPERPSVGFVHVRPQKGT